MQSRTAKITAWSLSAAVVLLLVAVVLVSAVTAQTANADDAPSLPATGSSPEADAKPEPAASAEPVSASECAESGRIVLGPMSASLDGQLQDRGARDLAAGDAGLNADGDVVTYTVEPGDALDAIGARFCIDNPTRIATLNHTRTIHPGDVLLLAPNPQVPWVPYFAPHEAPAGFEQIPYQRAVEAMSAAAHAGDVDAMRAIFADDLAGMFPRQADVDTIEAALDSGDLAVLRQMFA